MRKASLVNPFSYPLVVPACLLVMLPSWAEARQRSDTDQNVVYQPALLQAMEYRLAGPHRGGRVTAVTGVPGEPYTFYMGSTGGGVWKTNDGGRIWKNISDGFFEAGSMGALAVALSDANVIYAGTGSACIRGNVSAGIGAYKSTDAGRTWKHIGLPDAGQIARIRVHPKDPDLVYAAVLGHAFGPNEERGVFRSKDGGATWEKVLFVSDSTGAVDLSMDMNNPRILYAAMWRAERKPWTLIAGALEGGIYKTSDGGDTWTRLTEGLPEGLVGKIGVAVSPANSERVWAVIEAEKDQSGVYRSGDGGETWRRVNDDPAYTERPWYYNHLYADPKDENTVYIAGEDFWKSVDGGATFEDIPVPHGDNHDLWLNPDDPDILIEANDGGANVSYNGGRSWSSQVNQPTAEFYRVTVDDEFPYRIYGPQQDNSTISVPSRADGSGITIQRWLTVGGCETGPIAVNPQTKAVYAGCYGGRITRFDRTTGQRRQIMVYPEMQLGQRISDMRYRFQWQAPILVSPHDPGVLYHASQFVHRSTNEGQSWQTVSPDLTRNDVSKQGFAGEPVTHDITGVEVYGTIFALEESPHTPGEIWVGTNDGLVQLSRDNGATWTNITPSGLPEWSTVNMIELSAIMPGRASIAVYRYRMDDFRPYIFRTNDYGESWALLTDGRNGVPATHPTRVVREDPNRSGLLYAGTEFGMYVSFDDGAHWQSLQLNLPITPITDLAVHRNDLVVATQGRSFWILDDLSPLQQLTTEVASAPAYLFEPRAAYRTAGTRPGSRTTYVRDLTRGARLERHQAGDNPQAGAIVYYSLGVEPETATLEIVDGEGNVVRNFSSKAGDGQDTLPKKAGLNQFVWDLRYARANLVEGARPVGGPTAVPGTYQARLTVGEWSDTQSFEVLKDPRVATTLAHFREQFDLLIQIRDKLNDAHAAIRTIRSVRTQAKELAARLEETGNGEQIGDAAEAMNEKLAAVEGELIQTKPGSRVALQPKLTSQFGWLSSIVSSADARPTDQSGERFAELGKQLTENLDKLDQILTTDLAAFNALVQEQGIPPVIVPQRKGAGGVVSST